jgi:hypothetical protein
LKRLAQYSAVAVPVIALSGTAEAQVVYQDIDPDVVLDEIDENYGLDLNNDGNADFKFKVTDYGEGWYFAGLVPYPPSGSNLNGFAGYTQTFGGDPSIYGFPSMFNSGQVIDEDLQWKAMADLIWVSSSLSSYFYAGMLSNYYGSYFGQWSGAENKFLAIRFSPDGGESLHYAWIRCSVNTIGTILTLHDFAYEATAGTPIIAGALTAVSPVTPGPYAVFGYEGIVHITAPEDRYADTRVTITNMQGQVVAVQQLNGVRSEIDLRSLGKGIYVVTLKDGNEEHSHKVTFR